MAAIENRLYCGDNVEILDAHVPAESVDLCYVDPPFFSRRDYHHSSRRSRAIAFTDRWSWDKTAAREYHCIATEFDPTLPAPTIALLSGLHGTLGESPLLAYLVSLTRRIAAIWRVLASTGTFYLHCDPTASHYLKLVCDSIFCPREGEFRNEIIWHYETGGRSGRDFAWKHDTILRYAKSKTWTFDAPAVHLSRLRTRRNHMKRGIPTDVWTDLSHLHHKDPERVGYPTQKPLALLERIIRASSAENSVVLDAYCGSGTTLAAAQKLGRRWIGIDLSSEAIELTRVRLGFPPPVLPAAKENPTVD